MKHPATETVNETIIAHRTEDESSESSEEDIESGTDDEDAADQERSGIVRKSRRRSDTRSDIVRMRARDRFTIRDVEESISHFYGDDKLDITKWIEEFEDTSQLLGWDNLQKLIYAKRLLTGSAKQFVSFQRDIKSWSRLKRCLMREFKTKINSATIHRQLINRKRQPSESARRDMYAMQEIASQGSIDTVSLIEYIISGVPDEETNKTILYGANTLSQLKNALEKYDRMKESMNRKGKFVKQDTVRDKKMTRSEANKKLL
ncbi:hypothetical protein WH47_02476 [Habropoda laboriosa]|uniref:Retrotransposon gag domain-containing protein n=1 Tax=Habropoda laboriosa TaxID=597456 RepID=A0A0L7QJU0_9HYME|nr:hypothetical protein WH47_02476 [Habropoda laboriosa]